MADLMSVTEFGRRLGISRAAAYRIVAAGHVDRTYVHSGRGGKHGQTRISETAYTRYLAASTKRGRRAA